VLDRHGRLVGQEDAGRLGIGRDRPDAQAQGSAHPQLGLVVEDRRRRRRHANRRWRHDDDRRQAGGGGGVDDDLEHRP
jgi:hypothetical protein